MDLLAAAPLAEPCQPVTSDAVNAAAAEGILWPTSVWNVLILLKAAACLTHVGRFHTASDSVPMCSRTMLVAKAVLQMVQ
jgi:hypothetical protein